MAEEVTKDVQPAGWKLYQMPHMAGGHQRWWAEDHRGVRRPASECEVELWQALQAAQAPVVKRPASR